MAKKKNEEEGMTIVETNDVPNSGTGNRVVKVTIKGISPFSPSKPFPMGAHKKLKAANMKDDDIESELWSTRIHKAPDGTVIIPMMMLMLAIQAAAKRLNEKVPGKGHATWTKHFLSGIQVMDDARIEGLKADKVEGEWFYVHADGKRGSGTRVHRKFPMIYDWSTTFEVFIHDGSIVHEIFERVMKVCGQFIGLGRFAPRNGGTNGRFVVESIKWSTF